MSSGVFSFATGMLRRRFRPRKPPDIGPIVVLDDFFPNVYSGFRIAEYNAFLQRYANLTVYSTSPEFASDHAEYARRYPALAHRVRPFDPAVIRGASLAWIMFLFNAYKCLPFLEAAGVPFVFSLNPGGAFGLNEPASDAMLDPILASKMLRQIIVTQDITRTYLIERGVPPHKITLIYGGVMNARYVDEKAPSRAYYPKKPLLDVAFVAHKYMPQAPNKGFPDFCRLAANLAGDPAFAWHVAGHGFSDDDWPAALTRPDRFTFEGLLESKTTLWEFLRGVDIIVSPQRPFLLHQGNFDSFPTLGVVEASLQGAVMVCYDVLGMNHYYRDSVEIVVSPPDVDQLTSAVLRLKNDPKRMVSLAKAGQRRSRKLFSTSIQLGTRQKILERFAR
jgi:lipopolysaccharide transport system ATP-binding protein